MKIDFKNNLLPITFSSFFTHTGTGTTFGYPNKLEDQKIVLIVEDDVFMKPVISKAIYQIDPFIRIEWAESEDEAQKLIQIFKPDVLIVDCLLGPGKSGMDFWQHCKSVLPTTPFIMISGLGEEFIKRFNTEEQKEIPDLLQKPFYMKELQTKIAKLLNY